MNSRLTLFSAHQSFTRHLKVIPMHKKNGGGSGTPHVALNLNLWPYMLEQGHTVHAEFEFSIYNHSNGTYYGCKGRFMILLIQSHSSYYSWVFIVLFVL
jgi:hypothetical protein